MKTIKDLRDIMFETIEAVRNDKLSVDKANAVANLSREVINSLKTEIDFRKQMGVKSGSEFRPDAVPVTVTGSGPRIAPAPPPATEGKGYSGKLETGRR
jgi:hypothetical protein